METTKVNWNVTIDKQKGCIGWYWKQDVHPNRLCVEPVMAESWIGLHFVLFCKEIGLIDIVLERARCPSIKS
jgi:hypothetical protein